MDNLIKAVSPEEIQALISAYVKQPMGVLYLAGKQTEIANSVVSLIDWGKSKSMANTHFVKNVEKIGDFQGFRLPRFSIDEMLIFANGVVAISVGKDYYFAADDEEARSIFIKMFRTVERISEEI